MMKNWKTKLIVPAFAIAACMILGTAQVARATGNICAGPGSYACKDGAPNSVCQQGEECDDGNTVNGDGCDNNCMQTACGNGITTVGEECDLGSDTAAADGTPGVANDDASPTQSPFPGSACDTECRLKACGNGRVEGGELCDDGNTFNNDGCDSDPPPPDFSDSSHPGLCFSSGCGNGITNMDEMMAGGCDDGNTQSGDGCSATCVTEFCGDGISNDAPGETCDDGNTVNDDYCSNTCVGGSCGDGVLQAAVEQCDDGNTVNTDACRNACTTSDCGDGISDIGELCDDGNTVDDDTCLAACNGVPFCGDGITTANEDCDDGACTCVAPKKASNGKSCATDAGRDACAADGGSCLNVSGGLGVAQSFTVLGGSSVTAAGAGTVVDGDVGVSPGTSITGFPGSATVVNGSTHSNDGAAIAAQTTATALYVSLAGVGGCTLVGPDLNALVLTPGTYCVGAAASNNTGNLTLLGAGTYIFQASSTIITSVGSTVTLIGADPCDVFWQVTSAATLDGATFAGTVVAQAAITLGVGATLDGKAWTTSAGAVTMSGTNTVGGCTAAATPTGAPCGVTAGDGNLNDIADACRDTCDSASCGDGITDTGEVCDDGLAGEEPAEVDDNDSCPNGSTMFFMGMECSMINTCGDGVPNADGLNGNTCDNGQGTAPKTCSNAPGTLCSLNTDCGMDDTVPCGNSDAAGGTCHTTGFTDAECPNGAAAGACACHAHYCGDSATDVGEGCDDGNTAAAACNPAGGSGTVCTTNADCTGEICTSGACHTNCAGQDTCSATCALASCGDGITQAGEACDAGAANGMLNNHTPGADCTSVCGLNTCGDGEALDTEGCDDGNNVNTDDCLNNCAVAACGDTVTQTSGSPILEQCDDGNTVDAEGATGGTDGCSGHCCWEPTVALSTAAAQLAAQQCNLDHLAAEIAGLTNGRLKKRLSRHMATALKLSSQASAALAAGKGRVLCSAEKRKDRATICIERALALALLKGEITKATYIEISQKTLNVHGWVSMIRSMNGCL